MKNRKLVENATVVLKKMKGQGVLVNGNLILTAAHCITHSINGSMALGDYYIEEIETKRGNLRVAPLAVEPVSDIAVLGALDNQEFSEDVDRFEQFCDTTKPVPLCLKRVKPLQTFKVHILSHTGEWLNGTAGFSNKDAPNIYVEAEREVEGGTSGGPIVNELGELVGIVSFFSKPHGSGLACSGSSAFPILTLPVWACGMILAKKIL